ncbi:hypothetical protein [Herbiconiux daphne]|uniref:Bacterial transcriptional activator domain-containing protein n=1 Tax=Herbiconiux daphne TaxID=2970914 RepID=A0ABT2GY14_9MICO|nr:hypothetical protein [Herbiconiux daphne]MCS5732840.1 hypothetical protein [Herbiconiux daphne]
MPRVDRDPGVLDGRTTKMVQFVEATEIIFALADDDDLRDVVVTLAVHAGIAASDVICLRRLGCYWQSGNHHDAIEHLRRADAESAGHLSTLLSLKTRAGYGHSTMSTSNVTRSVRAMQHLAAAARRA